MKISIVSHSDGAGGAAIAAARLHESLLAAGAASRMLVRQRASALPQVQTVGLGAGLNRWRSPLVGRSTRWLGLASAERPAESWNLLPSRLAPALNASDADVVNVHWIHRESMSLADVSRITKPVVLTLHDMWWMLGTEHYRDDFRLAAPPWAPQPLPGGDAGPSTATRWSTIDAWMVARKRRSLPARVAVVSPSQWLADQARRSTVFAGVEVVTLANALPLQTFRPLPAEQRAALKQRLGFPAAKTTFSFGAFNVDSDTRKGAREMVAALQALAALGLGDAVHLAVFGGSAPAALRELPFSLTEVGVVRGEAPMAELLNAADAAVVPSLLENLPQTATEAVACGCPVLGFAISGMCDAVMHGKTGLLAAPYDPADLARHMAMLTRPEARVALAAEGPSHAQAHWHPARVAERHLQFFERFAAEPPRVRTRSAR